MECIRRCIKVFVEDQEISYEYLNIINYQRRKKVFLSMLPNFVKYLLTLQLATVCRKHCCRRSLPLEFKRSGGNERTYWGCWRRWRIPWGRLRSRTTSWRCHKMSPSDDWQCYLSRPCFKVYFVESCTALFFQLSFFENKTKFHYYWPGHMQTYWLCWTYPSQSY